MAQRKILVIEDDESIREALEEIFSGEGYSVVVAENGKAGLAAMMAARPCLVLLDLMMPVMDGRGFLRAVEESGDPALQAIPVVLITAAGEKGAAGCKVSEVLIKPLDIDKLLQVARNRCAPAAADG